MGEKKVVFKKIKVENISIKEMMKHIDFIKKNGYIIVNGPRIGKCHNRYVANIEMELVNFKLTYRNEGKTTQYICRLDDEEKPHKINGLTAYTTLSKYWKIPNLKEIKIYGYRLNRFGKVVWNVDPTQQLMYYNKEKNNNRYYDCVGYDMNSAFSRAMLEPIPDTSQMPRIEETVKAGEIGFRLDGTVVFEKGLFANYIFPLMDSPFETFVRTWYFRKASAKTPEAREKAKGMLNYSVGYMHRVNPFIRNCIVARCNEFIKKLIDENTLYCNTDSIVSCVKREDIEKNLGSDIGQWKIEHKGAFAYREYTYQWNDTEPKYRGIPKKGFKTFKEEHGRAWDLLVDPPPKQDFNVYVFDMKEVKFKKVELKEGQHEEI